MIKFAVGSIDQSRLVEIIVDLPPNSRRHNCLIQPRSPFFSIEKRQIEFYRFVRKDFVILRLSHRDVVCPGDRNGDRAQRPVGAGDRDRVGIGRSDGEFVVGVVHGVGPLAIGRHREFSVALVASNGGERRKRLRTIDVIDQERARRCQRRIGFGQTGRGRRDHGGIVCPGNDDRDRALGTVRTAHCQAIGISFSGLEFVVRAVHPVGPVPLRIQAERSVTLGSRHIIQCRERRRTVDIAHRQRAGRVECRIGLCQVRRGHAANDCRIIGPVNIDRDGALRPVGRFNAQGVGIGRSGDKFVVGRIRPIGPVSLRIDAERPVVATSGHVVLRLDRRRTINVAHIHLARSRQNGIGFRKVHRACSGNHRRVVAAGDVHRDGMAGRAVVTAHGQAVARALACRQFIGLGVVEGVAPHPGTGIEGKATISAIQIGRHPETGLPDVIAYRQLAAGCRITRHASARLDDIIVATGIGADAGRVVDRNLDRGGGVGCGVDHATLPNREGDRPVRMVPGVHREMHLPDLVVPVRERLLLPSSIDANLGPLGAQTRVQLVTIGPIGVQLIAALRVVDPDHDLADILPCLARGKLDEGICIAQRVTTLAVIVGRLIIETGLAARVVLVEVDRHARQQIVVGAKVGRTNDRRNLDLPGRIFELPIASLGRAARGIGRRRDVGACRLGHGIDEGRARTAAGDVAAVEQDVAVGAERLADFLQVGLMRAQRRLVDVLAA